MNIFDLEVKTIDGKNVKLEDYKGKVLLVMNSATECGFTPQYDELQDLYEKYHSKGFEILDFPSNQFGGQAPGENSEIKNFCEAKFGVTFPQFEKVDVNGENQSPLFKELKEKTEFKGLDKNHPIGKILDDMLSKAGDYEANNDIKWNFTKFLIDKEGNIVERIEPTTSIEEVGKKVAELLAK